MSNIVRKTLDTVWVLYGICGAGLVMLSTIYMVDEEIFMYVAILYGILGIILLIISRYNKPIKTISFEEEFREDLYNLEYLTMSPTDKQQIDRQQIDKQPVSSDIPSGNPEEENILNNILKKTKPPPKIEIAHNQSFDSEQSMEAFSTSATNGLFMM